MMEHSTLLNKKPEGGLVHQLKQMNVQLGWLWLRQYWLLCFFSV